MAKLFNHSTSFQRVISIVKQTCQNSFSEILLEWRLCHPMKKMDKVAQKGTFNMEAAESKT